MQSRERGTLSISVFLVLISGSRCTLGSRLSRALSRLVTENSDSSIKPLFFSLVSCWKKKTDWNTVFPSLICLPDIWYCDSAEVSRCSNYHCQYRCIVVGIMDILFDENLTLWMCLALQAFPRVDRRSTKMPFTTAPFR